jgi:hypothetical protein
MFFLKSSVSKGYTSGSGGGFGGGVDWMVGTGVGKGVGGGVTGGDDVGGGVTGGDDVGGGVVPPPPASGSGNSLKQKKNLSVTDADDSFGIIETAIWGGGGLTFQFQARACPSPARSQSRYDIEAVRLVCSEESLYSL